MGNFCGCHRICSKSDRTTMTISLSQNLLTSSCNLTETREGTSSTTPSCLSIGGRKVVIALHNYSGMGGDLSFSKGDKMIILDSKEKDWYYVKHFITKTVGYIPISYVEDVKSLAKEEWYFGKMNRRLAERLLMTENLFLGTFLVRESEKFQDEFCLSVRSQDSGGTIIVCHYKIKINNEDDQIFIHPQEKFTTLQDLIKFYMINAHDICHRLVVPCDKPQPDLVELSHCLIDNWEIDRNDLQFVKFLGCGKYGDVWLGKWQDQIEVAIKSLKAGSMTRQLFLEEAQVMKMCKHENLVPLYAVCSKDEPIFMVVEYMNKGNLKDYLRKGEGRNFILPDMLDVLTQIASGMLYLESIKLIHRDLSARNVLIKDINRVKIADFGLARLVQAGEYECGPVGDLPIKWASIESIEEGIFTVKSDVWSFGVTALEIFTFGDTPYNTFSNDELVNGLKSGYREPKPSICPNSVYNIILQCWTVNPNNRPSFKDIFTFFTDYHLFEHEYKDFYD